MRLTNTKTSRSKSNQKPTTSKFVHLKINYPMITWVSQDCSVSSTNPKNPHPYLKNNSHSSPSKKVNSFHPKPTASTLTQSTTYTNDKIIQRRSLKNSWVSVGSHSRLLRLSILQSMELESICLLIERGPRRLRLKRKDWRSSKDLSGANSCRTSKSRGKFCQILILMISFPMLKIKMPRGWIVDLDQLIKLYLFLTHFN